MINAQPLPLIEDLLSKIDHIWSSLTVDQFSLRRIRLEVEKLIKNRVGDLALNYAALAWIELIQCKRELAYYNFENAMRIDPSNGRVALLYSGALALIGDVRKAAEITNYVARAFPGNSSVLEKAFLRNVTACQFSEAVEIGKQLRKLSVNDGVDRVARIELFVDDIQNLALATSHCGLTEEGMLERLEVAVGAVRSDFEIQRFRITSVGNCTFLGEMYIDADFDRCADMNFKIADVIVENFEQTGAELGSFICMPLHTYFGEKVF